MKSFRIIALCATLAVAATFTSSCKTVTVVDTKGTAYTLSPKFGGSGGYHSVIVGADLEKAYKATIKGLADLDIAVSEKRSDKLTAQVSGTLADGKTYSIKLDKLDQGTSMKLYFGDWGSNQRVQQIFKAISDRF